jgi:hypothetical protein
LTKKDEEKTFICVQKSFPSFGKRAESFHAISCVVNFLLAPLFYVLFFHALLRSDPLQNITHYFSQKLKNTQKQGNEGTTAAREILPY